MSRQGAVLVLRTSAVPARSLRVLQANTKSPRFHVHDYTRVDVEGDGRVVPGPGELTLEVGTRLVVLDVKVQGSAVRIFHAHGEAGTT